VIEEDGEVTVVDTGYPGYRPQLRSAVAAILITHAHADHVGSARAVHDDTGARVLVHPADADVVRDGSPEPPPSFFAQAWRPRFARYLVHAARNGARSITPVPSVETFVDGETLDVPGRPRVLHTPGHTAGHCALLLEDRGVIFSGDALVTRDNVSG